MKYIGLISAILIFPFSKCVYSQQLISSSGNHMETEAGQISWSIGELMTKTLENNTNIISQGLHQPDYQVTLLESTTKKEFDLEIYPNPVRNNLVLKFKNNIPVNTIRYQIIDITGKVIFESIIINQETVIPMETYKPSTYVIVIYESNTKLHSLQIIKK